MKKFKKFFLATALLLCATTAMPAISQVASVANAATSFSYLEIEKFVDEVNVGGTYQIAGAKVATNDGSSITYSNTGVTVDVKNPYGAPVSVSAENTFSVDYVGTYSINYVWGEYSHVLKVNAVEGIYSMSFKENSRVLIPEYVNVEKYTGKIALPNPVVKDADGKEIENAIIAVDVYTPSNTKLGATDLVKNQTTNLYEFTATEVGVYTVSYKYKSADGRVLATKSVEFTANKTFNNNYKLTFEYDTTKKPETAVTGVETTLPGVIGKNATTEEEVGVYYTITAKKITYNQETGKVLSEEDVTNQVISGNKFTANQDGDYVITYNVKNFFGTQAQSSSFKIKGVKDSQAPVVRLVKPYTTAPAEGEDVVVSLVEKADTKNLVLPAIFADDNVSKNLADLTLTRKIVKSNGDIVFESSENPNKELVFNYENVGGFTLDENTQVQATLKEGMTLGNGIYNVIYIAKDKAGNEKESEKFRLVLEAGFVDDENPTIEWNKSEALPVQARIGDKVTFAVPTVSDNVDTRIETVVKYVFVGDTEPQDSDYKELKLVDGHYEIEVEEANELRLRATAVDNAGNSQTINAFIDIVDTNDQAVTTIKEVGSFAGGYKRGDEIDLPVVSYQDDYSDYVNVGVYIKTSDNKPLSVYDGYNDVTEGTPVDTIDYVNAKVLASYEGEYNVAYVSKDYNNNYTIYFDSFEVAPYVEDLEIGFTSLPTTLNNGTMELGETIKMPAAEIVAPQGVSTSYVVRQISGPTSEDTILNKFEFKPAVKGTYKIQYYGKVNTTPVEYVEKTFTVEVKDTTGPVIGEVDVEERVAVGYDLTIPQFTAFDLSGIDEENSKVVLSSNKYGSKTIAYGDTTTNRVVKLNNNEIYTLTFTAQDIYGNSSTLKKTIKVGDTTKPVIEINEEDKKFVPESLEIGDKLSLDLSKISVYDYVNGEKVNLDKNDLIVVLTRDNTPVENIHGESKDKYEFNLDEAGTYKLEIKIKDAVENESEPYTKSFTINKDVNEGTDKNEVVGIVLLVVSIVLLAGVIVYFIVSKKKNDKYKG